MQYEMCVYVYPLKMFVYAQAHTYKSFLMPTYTLSVFMYMN